MHMVDDFCFNKMIHVVGFFKTFAARFDWFSQNSNIFDETKNDLSYSNLIFSEIIVIYILMTIREYDMLFEQS